MGGSCVSFFAVKLRSWTGFSQVSGHILNLDHELALFSDEIVVRAREMEAEALAAHTARNEQAQHAMTVCQHVHMLVCMRLEALLARGFCHCVTARVRAHLLRVLRLCRWVAPP